VLGREATGDGERANSQVPSGSGLGKLPEDTKSKRQRVFFVSATLGSKLIRFSTLLLIPCTSFSLQNL
jgi:hypothetical protein